MQDCRDVEALIQRTFSPSEGPTGLIVYVGQRHEYATLPYTHARDDLKQLLT